MESNSSSTFYRNRKQVQRKDAKHPGSYSKQGTSALWHLDSRQLNSAGLTLRRCSSGEHKLWGLCLCLLKDPCSPV